ncbi:MAG: pyruvate dehydrogenase complex dihydrolipoamide acetyltransferase [Longimicrobiales bacterium]
MEALSPTMEEGQLVRWLKAEGDAVSDGDLLAEIETDKATMELVARGQGILRRVFLEEGGTMAVGSVIAVIADADDDISGIVESAGAGAGGGGEGVPSPPTPPDGGPPPGGKAEGIPSEPAAAPGGPTDSSGGSDGGRLKASPLARRLAEESGLDLRGVQGSGPGGRIVKRDVEIAREMETQASSAPSAIGTSRLPFGLRGPDEDFEDVPLSQMRKTIAKRLVESLGPVPHFFLRIVVDMARIVEARKRVNALLEEEGEKVSINDFILRATAQALSRHPEVNAQWNGDSVRRHFRVHLGVAVAVEEGLITPVVRDANVKGLVEISREVRELASRGREKRLQPEEYTGSTFSVSNLGMFGIHEFTGVINPPEAGILAVGGIEDTAVVDDGRVVVKPLMRVTMSCDHRVIDGATGARFLQTLKGMLEEPAAILL